MTIHGETARGFDAVRAAAARVLADGGGFALAASVHGRPVVDLWSGSIGRDGLVHTWSVIKPVTGTCLLLLVERGALRLDDPVGGIWPELSAGPLTVADVLTHAAGLVTVPGGDVANLVDRAATVSALERATPDWRPGGHVGEHAMTFGHLVGELVRRVDGRGLGRFLADELAGPHGLDLHVGLAGGDLARVGDLRLPPGWWAETAGPPGRLRHRAIGAGVDAGLVNSATWRRAEIGAVNGHATARALARFYALVLDGTLPASIAEPGRSGDDLVLGRPVTWTLAGGQIAGTGADVDLGMGGVGGSYAGARPAHGLAWAFLTTSMGGFERTDSLEAAVLACI